MSGDQHRPARRETAPQEGAPPYTSWKQTATLTPSPGPGRPDLPLPASTGGEDTGLMPGPVSTLPTGTRSWSPPQGVWDATAILEGPFLQASFGEKTIS